MPRFLGPLEPAASDVLPHLLFTALSKQWEKERNFQYFADHWSETHEEGCTGAAAWPAAACSCFFQSACGARGGGFGTDSSGYLSKAPCLQHAHTPAKTSSSACAYTRQQVPQLCNHPSPCPTQVLRGLTSFRYQDVFEQPNKQPIKFRKVSGDFVSTTTVNGKEILQVWLLCAAMSGI
eukprot:1160499-Pelagomonas_calceolata.AAC.6